MDGWVEIDRERGGGGQFHSECPVNFWFFPLLQQWVQQLSRFDHGETVREEKRNEERERETNTWTASDAPDWLDTCVNLMPPENETDKGNEREGSKGKCITPAGMYEVYCREEDSNRKAGQTDREIDQSRLPQAASVGVGGGGHGKRRR
mmetsp:Transcript_14620/g.29473  ORF Transcript_14620/g.29473 Transcript_14620/m.29473 type:complete len:149 (-) Transcript_14620:228-674(-)